MNPTFAPPPPFAPIDWAATLWLPCIHALAEHQPELKRALGFMADAQALLEHQAPVKKLQALVAKFLGNMRQATPSNGAKFACRGDFIRAWWLAHSTTAHIMAASPPAPAPAPAPAPTPTANPTPPPAQAYLGAEGWLALGFAIAQKLLAIHSKLGHCLEEPYGTVVVFLELWFKELQGSTVHAAQQAEWVYALHREDDSMGIPEAFWKKHLAAQDRSTVLQLLDQEIAALPPVEFGKTTAWTQFEHRWRRKKIIAFLNHVQEWSLLATLACKSALFAAEAVEAIAWLVRAQRSRDALVYAEQCYRRQPNSQDLAKALLKLYQDDGWDEETTTLAQECQQRWPGAEWLKNKPQGE